jgi:hypothetical protein
MVKSNCLNFKLYRMSYLTKFIYGPGGEDDGVNSGTAKPADQKEVDPKTGETEEQKPIIDKIKDALQDWANKDEADQEFDDTRV